MVTLSDVANVIQHFAGCSREQADSAARLVCRDPEALQLLMASALRCGVATAGVGIGGVIAVAGATPTTSPLMAAGFAIGTASAVKAKEFCTTMVERGLALDAVPDGLTRLLEH